MPDDHKAAPLAAMEKLGLTVESQFVPFSQSRNKDAKQPGLNWRVTLKRNGRDVLTTDYSAGMGYCPGYKQAARWSNYDYRQRITHECETGTAARAMNGGLILKGKPILPDACDVLCSLIMDSSVLDAAGFEDWASEFGYEPDSRKAETIYRGCLELALKLRAAVGEAGLEALREAFQDY